MFRTSKRELCRGFGEFPLWNPQLPRSAQKSLDSVGKSVIISPTLYRTRARLRPGLSSFQEVLSALIPKLLAALALLAALLGLSFLVDLPALLDPERFTAWLDSLGPVLAPLALIATLALAVVVSPIPSVPLDAAAGIAFGPWLGTLYASVGALLGSLIAFGIARALGRELVERWVGGHISFCETCSDHLLFRVVLVARLLPFLSFDVISYGTGLTKMSARRFAVATWLGMLPLTAAYVSLGAIFTLDGSVLIALGLAAVALFLLLPRWIERNDLFGLRRLFAAHLSPSGTAPRS